MKSKVLVIAAFLLIASCLGCTSPEKPAAPYPEMAEEAAGPEPPSGGQRRMTGRAFLPASEVEEPGYGLYSYLLFAKRPDDSNRDRYLAAIEEFLLVEEIAALETYIARERLNVFYLPLAEDAPAEPDADWVLKNYDYARALGLIAALPRSERFTSGPYIVSTAAPLGGRQLVSESYLLQNLSTVPPVVVPAWVAEFKRQAARPEFWKRDGGKMIVLQLRTFVAIAAEGYGVVEEAVSRASESSIFKLVKSWISWDG
jgi:hypothetical protein